LFSENPTPTELGGEVGCCSLLVRAVKLCDEVGQPSWSFVAQQLRHVDNIDGSVMQMILTHSSTELSADVLNSSSAEHQCDDASLSVQKLLKQFPFVLPTSLPQFLVNPSALPAGQSVLIA